MIRSLLIPSLAVLAFSGPVQAAQPGFGAWSGSDQARVRLIAAGIGDDGQLSGGIEIMLQPGWWTYWRSPGAAGIPPVIDFAGSENLGDVTVSFPLPQRHDDGYGASNVYVDGVLLPFRAAVPDPSAPVEMKLALGLGVCSEVCIPEHVEVALTIAPGVHDRVAAATLAGARAQVPGAPVPGTLAVESAHRSGGSDEHPVFDLAVTAPKDAKIFVEGPADWFAGVPERLAEGGGAAYRVTFDRVGARTPIVGVELRVTLASGGQAVEQTVPID
ncbi:MAG: hypothetical protein KDK07_12715 [Bauldia sp.]|nr:hypothetical protein [Bauldia sp.]